MHLVCFPCFLFTGEKCYPPLHVVPAFMQSMRLNTSLSLVVIIVGECEIETRKTVWWCKCMAENYNWKGLVTSQPPGGDRSWSCCYCGCGSCCTSSHNPVKQQRDVIAFSFCEKLSSSAPSLSLCGNKEDMSWCLSASHSVYVPDSKVNWTICS